MGDNNHQNEMTYKVKSNMLRKLDHEIRHVTAETSLHHQLKQLQKMQHIQLARLNERDQNISRLNAVKLMRKYERLHIQSEKRLKECEEKLDTIQKLAERYHDLYLQEKSENRSGKSGNKSSRSDNTGAKSERPSSKVERSSSAKNKRPVTVAGHEKGSSMSLLRMLEDDLDDDEAIFKRQIMRLVDSGSLSMSGPIRVEDVMRKNETLLLENEKLKNEVERLKFDNGQLLLKCKHAEEYKSDIVNHMTTSEANRTQLLVRLDKEQKKYNILNRSLTQSTAEWIQSEQESEQQIRQARHKKIESCSVLGADGRLQSHQTRKNTDKPRKMYPVEKYASANQQ